MTTTQRPRPSRQGQPPNDPAMRGVILVAVAVVLGVVLLIKGGGVGFDPDTQDVEIGTDGGADSDTVESTTTTEPPPQTSVPTSALRVVALNAAGVNGYAGKAEQFLNVAGYTNVTAETALTGSDVTMIHYAEGFQVDALMLAQIFGLEPHQVQPIPADTQLARDPSTLPAEFDVVILLAQDVAATVESGAGGAAGTGGETPDATAGGGTSGSTGDAGSGDAGSGGT